MRSPAETGRHVARLGETAVTILESVYQHRLLSTAQLHALHTPSASPRWTRKLLGRLRETGLIAVTRAPGGLGLWYMTARGADAVELLGGRAEQRRKLLRAEQAAGPLQSHTLAVNDVGLAFVKAARAHEHECGPFAWRHEIAHPIGPAPGRRRPEQLIADAILTYQLAEPDGPPSYHYRFIELDRATIAVEHLADKLARYARLKTYVLPRATQPAWRSRYPVFPHLLLVLDGRLDRDALERRRRNVLALARAHPALREPARIGIAICLLADLTRRGPFAPIFLTLAEPRKRSDWLGSTLEDR